MTGSRTRIRPPTIGNGCGNIRDNKLLIIYFLLAFAIPFACHVGAELRGDSFRRRSYPTPSTWTHFGDEVYRDNEQHIDDSEFGHIGQGSRLLTNSVTIGISGMMHGRMGKGSKGKGKGKGQGKSSKSSKSSSKSAEHCNIFHGMGKGKGKGKGSKGSWSDDYGCPPSPHQPSYPLPSKMPQPTLSEPTFTFPSNIGPTPTPMGFPVLTPSPTAINPTPSLSDPTSPTRGPNFPTNPTADPLPSKPPTPSFTRPPEDDPTANPTTSADMSPASDPDVAPTIREPPQPEPTDGCSVGEDGLFGSQLGLAEETEFAYQTTVTPSVMPEELELDILELVERAMAPLVLEQVFSRCREDGATAEQRSIGGKWMRKLQASEIEGWSIRPRDIVVETAECVDVDAFFPCFVIQGRTTSYAEGKISDATSKSIADAIRNAIETGNLATVDNRLLAVNYRDLNQFPISGETIDDDEVPVDPGGNMTDDDMPDDPNGTSTLPKSEGDDRLLEPWMIALIAVAGAIGACLIYLCLRRPSHSELDVDESSSSSSSSSSESGSSSEKEPLKRPAAPYLPPPTTYNPADTAMGSASPVPAPAPAPAPTYSYPPGPQGAAVVSSVDRFADEEVGVGDDDGVSPRSSYRSSRSSRSGMSSRSGKSSRSSKGSRSGKSSRSSKSSRKKSLASEDTPMEEESVEEESVEEESLEKASGSGSSEPFDIVTGPERSQQGSGITLELREEQRDNTSGITNDLEFSHPSFDPNEAFDPTTATTAFGPSSAFGEPKDIAFGKAGGFDKAPSSFDPSSGGSGSTDYEDAEEEYEIEYEEEEEGLRGDEEGGEVSEGTEEIFWDEPEGEQLATGDVAWLPGGASPDARHSFT